MSRLFAVFAFVVVSLCAHVAFACGCLSPPLPDGEEEFAVNQSAEQIVFEVGTDGFITAHVLIRYNGAPANFAWIVPVPNAPELSLSSSELFGLLDNETKPLIDATPTSDLSPADFFLPVPIRVRRKQRQQSEQRQQREQFERRAPPVTVVSREQIGSYETIVFDAQDAALAVDWLQSEGFIVNDTMTPYMQPYLDAGMLFVASKLVAGAGIDEIRPLKMRYQATQPMIPLQLTAVAAEPHLTVTTYILADSLYEPEGRPIVEMESEDIARTLDGRDNYPMAMARKIDEAGGDGFVIEYHGATIRDPGFVSNCCIDQDICNIGGNGDCECPLSEFESADCEDNEGLRLGAQEFVDMMERHGFVSRITTRLSAHEMTFDPTFSPTTVSRGQVSLGSRSWTAQDCESSFVDVDAYRDALESFACISVYCGSGSCAVDSDGNAGCACDAGFVARQFTDLDGSPSVTCVPEINTVDLAAGGLELPGACKGRTCGANGTCVDVGGFATCDCDSGSVAIPSGTAIPVPTCEPSVATFDSGARDYTQALADLEICYPQIPTCDGGWISGIRHNFPDVNYVECHDMPRRSASNRS